MSLTIRHAAFPADTATLETLFGRFLQDLFARMPEHRAAMARKYDPARIPEQVADFARLHAPPKGALLIADLDGVPVGCAMMRELQPGIVEIQRVFVMREARGHGAGRALTLALMDRARRDGQTRVRLDTSDRMTEAVGLYRSLGFETRSAYHANTPELAGLLTYFERTL